MDASYVAEFAGTAPDAAERAALVERYGDGECLVFAFAVHWMTGWHVEAVVETGSSDFAHFAPVDPDRLVWDSAGPRSRSECGSSYADRPRWTRIDPLRFLATQPGVEEDAITEACREALRLHGDALAVHVRRLPEPTAAACSPGA